MGHYDLNRMGWQQFEHMVQALAKAQLGNGVRPFGAGRDGQRDATFRGSVDFPVGAGETWDGYGVIQVKYNERPRNTTADWQWFIGQIRTELRSWAGKRRLGKETPAYLLVATNIALSGTEETGGKDQFEALMSNSAGELGLTGWYVWDDNEIRTMLDRHTTIRQRYLEQIITGDLLVQLEALLPKSTALEAERLAGHVVAELISRQWVRTGDAGYRDQSKVRLADIAIDLPCVRRVRTAEGRQERIGTAKTTIQLGDLGLSISQGAEPQGVVIVGGPGQGKSTIAQVIAHSYRVAFLAGTDVSRFGSSAEGAYEGLRDRLDDAGIPRPLRRRWPIVVELARAGTAIAAHDGTFSLLRYIAQSIVVAGEPADPGALLDWMRSWPTCLILDGLDEVPDAKVRTRLMDSISAFASELSSNGADLLVVATTRPQGYRGEFAEALPCRQLDLLEFTEAEALSYSEALTAARSFDDPDLAARVTERLITAVHERVTQRLMTTPLQVTIMTALAEDALELPTDRFELFDRYYRVVYERELAKSDAFLELRTLRQHIDHLHEQAGLRLQTRTELASRSDAVLTRADIARILRRRLTSAGFDDHESETIADKLVKLSTERLVMLVSRKPSKFEFEVRSLQEYMAARALTDGDDATVLDGLRDLIPSSHWRNTWLLAAGRLVRSREHLTSALVEIVTSYDATAAETPATRLGAALAGDLYLDNIGSEFPAVRRSLLACAITQFADTTDELPSTLTDLIDMAMAPDSRESEIALAALDEMSRAHSSSLATKYLSEHKSGMNPIAKQARSTLAGGRTYVRPIPGRGPSTAETLAGELARTAPTISEALVLADRLRAAPPSQNDGMILASVDVLQSLEQKAAREALARTVDAISRGYPHAAALGTALLRINASRALRGARIFGDHP